jgi:hypothetical protein
MTEKKGAQPYKPDGGGGRRAQDEHKDAGPAGAATVGAAVVHGDASRQEAAQNEEGEAIHPGLQTGVRTLLHPRRRSRRAGRAGEQPGAHGLAHGAVADDASPVREHVQQLTLVRAGLQRGQGEDPAPPPGVADRVRVRVQVQQRRVEGRASGYLDKERRSLLAAVVASCWGGASMAPVLAHGG